MPVVDRSVAQTDWGYSTTQYEPMPNIKQVSDSHTQCKYGQYDTLYEQYDVIREKYNTKHEKTAVRNKTIRNDTEVRNKMMKIFLWYIIPFQGLE